jgi:hypothetical protein
LIILVSIVDLTGLSGESPRQLQLYRFRRAAVQTRRLLSTPENSFVRSGYAGLFETAA